MNALGIAVAFIIFVAGVFVGQRAFFTQQIPEKQERVLSEQEGEEENDQTPTQPLVSSPTTPPTGSPTTPPTGGPTNTRTPQKEDIELSLFIYPGASVISSTQETASLQSNDNSDAITEWYKEKIKAQGMSVTSFVTTKTNDNVLNKLVGADGAKEVRVEIRKDSGNSLVKIEISLKTTS